MSFGPSPPSSSDIQQAGYNAQGSNAWTTVGPTQRTDISKTVGANGVPSYTATTSLTPDQQALFNQRQDLQSQSGNKANAQLRGMYDQPANIDSIKNSLIQQEVGDYSKQYNQFRTIDEQNLDAKLASMGFGSGSTGTSMAADTARAKLNQNWDNQLAFALGNYLPTAQSLAVQRYNLPLQTAEQFSGLAGPAAPNSYAYNPPAGTQISPGTQEGALQQGYANASNFADAWAAPFVQGAGLLATGSPGGLMGSSMPGMLEGGGTLFGGPDAAHPAQAGELPWMA